MNDVFHLQKLQAFQVVFSCLQLSDVFSSLSNLLLFCHFLGLVVSGG